MWWKKRQTKDQPAKEPPGPNDAIAAFWAFWARSRDDIAKAIEKRTLDRWTDPISSAVKAIHPDLAWELGAGTQAQHYMCISAEGDMALRVVCERWLSRAPAVDATWEYRAAKPGDSRPGCVISFAGVDLDLDEALISVERDEDRERAHVTFFHPRLHELEPALHKQVAFIVLDATLGEDDVERWIGAIETSLEPAEGALTLSELDASLSAWREPREPTWTMLRSKARDGSPILVLANLAVKRVDHLLMDTHLAVEIRYDGERNQGLPESEELSILQQLEAELIDELGRDAVHIATETTQGTRTNHFHVASQGPALTRAHAWERAHPERQIEITAQLDPTWEITRRW
jgi:hypothetical protein